MDDTSAGYSQPLTTTKVDFSQYELTDEGNARAFLDMFAGTVRFHKRRWVVKDDSPDLFGETIHTDAEMMPFAATWTETVLRLAEETQERGWAEARDAGSPEALARAVEGIQQLDEIAKHAIRSQAPGRLRAMIRLAKSTCRGNGHE
jgi:hypothetical protein